MKKNDVNLYNVFLDVSYGLDFINDYIGDMELELKIARKTRNKLKKRKELIINQYEKIHGEKPIRLIKG